MFSLFNKTKTPFWPVETHTDTKECSQYRFGSVCGINGQLWSKRGKDHKLTGPSYLIYFNEQYTHEKTWYFNNNIHRIDGPAYVENNDGQVEVQWIRHGACYTDSSLKERCFS